MAALTASLGRVARVDERHPNANGFSLVGNERSELGKTPTVQTTPLLLTDFSVAADISQIFQDDSPTRSYGVHDTSRNDVIAVSSEACLFATEDPQTPLGALGPFGLALPFPAEEACFYVLPTSFTDKLPITGHGGSINAEIDADDGVIRCYDWRWHFDNDVEPESSFVEDKIGGAGFSCYCPRKNTRKEERDIDSSFHGGQANHSRNPVNLERVNVVSWRAAERFRAGNSHPFSFQRKGRLDSLSSLHPGLDVMVTHKVWELLFKIAIGGVVEAYSIFLLGVPSDATHGVKSYSELSRSFQQDGFLAIC